MKTNNPIITGCLLGVVGGAIIVLAQLGCAFAGEVDADTAIQSPLRTGDRSSTIENPIAYAGLMAAEVTCLTDQELNLIRGGLAGLHFGISFEGIFDKLGNLTGQIFSGNEQVPQELVEAVVKKSNSSDDNKIDGNRVSEAAAIQRADVDGASISAYVGNFDGASGIFQISQSPGSYNVITNNMTINISIYNFASESQASTILPRLLNAQ